MLTEEYKLVIVLHKNYPLMRFDTFLLTCHKRLLQFGTRRNIYAEWLILLFEVAYQVQVYKGSSTHGVLIKGGKD